MKTINSLEDLMKIIDISSLKNNENRVDEDIDNISDDVIVGGESTNSIVNRVFTYRFLPEDVECFRKIFTRLKNGEMNNGKIYNTISELKTAAKDMKNNNSYPLEAMLYASKEINVFLNNNETLLNSLGSLTKDIYETMEYKYKTAFQYILSNWKWIPQLNIVINACGKIKDKDLLESVYVNMINETKYESFKAFVNSGFQECIPNIMKCMSLVEEGNMLSNKICRYFNQYFGINFGKEGLEVLREYLSVPQFSVRGRKEINKILPLDTIEGEKIMTLGDLINCVKEEKFDEIRRCAANTRLRRNAYIALRWANGKENRGKAETILLNGLKVTKNNSEIGEILISLAMIDSESVEEEANKYLRNNISREYCYTALIIRNHYSYKDKLINEIFENGNITAYNLLRQCKKQMSEVMEQNMKNYLTGTNIEKVINGLKIAPQIVNSDILNLKPIIFEEINKLIDKENIYEHVSAYVVNAVKYMFDENNEQKLIPILFKVFKNNKSTINDKAKAKALLLSVGAEIPR